MKKWCILLYTVLQILFSGVYCFQDSEINFHAVNKHQSDLQVPLEFTITFTLSWNIVADEAITIKLPRLTRRLGGLDGHGDFHFSGHDHGLYEAPTGQPSGQPSGEPTKIPTPNPTEAPTTAAPTTAAPTTAAPTTAEPTEAPTQGADGVSCTTSDQCVNTCILGTCGQELADGESCTDDAECINSCVNSVCGTARRRLDWEATGDHPSDDYAWSVKDGQYDIAMGGVRLSPSSIFKGAWSEGQFVNYNDSLDNTVYPIGVLTLMRVPDHNGSMYNTGGFDAFPTRLILKKGSRFSVKIYRSNGIGAHVGFPASDSDDSYFGTSYAYPFKGRNPNFDPFIISTNYSMGPGQYMFDVRAWWAGTSWNHIKDIRLDNVTHVIQKFNQVGPGCRNIGGCHGRGVCDYQAARCRCFEGHGKRDDMTIVGLDIAANCSQSVCPSGKAIADVAVGSVMAHGAAECSNAGICDRNSGTCKCFPPWTGAACDRMRCPNDCSGHGVCLSMRAITRLMNIKGSTHSSDVYYSQDIEYGAHLNDYAPSTFGSHKSTAWDRDTMFQCLCDSSWPVGYESGMRQLSEWFGPDCSLRRCPSGDDPYTTIDETRCTGQNQLGNDWPDKGHIGNYCHIDCSNRGTCDYATGQCNCYEGFYSDNCSQTSRAGVHEAPHTIPTGFYDYDNDTIGQLIY